LPSPAARATIRRPSAPEDDIMIRTVTATTLLLVGGLAMAQQRAAPETPTIEPGTLSAFSEYDVNGDGIVAIAEFEALLPVTLRPAGLACDSDRDGRLSEREFLVCGGNDPVVVEPVPR
jgi:hypothetical protein